MRLILLCLTASFGFLKNTQASDSLYVRHLVDTLSSPYFFGRGYVNEGMKKAAYFVEGEMKKLGLQSIGKRFQQPFSFPVNVFDGAMSLQINGVALTPGKDFLIGNESRSINTKGTLTQADSVTWINAGERIIIKLVDKLTWDVEQFQADYTSFRILRSALKETPQNFEATADARLIKGFEANNVAGMVRGTTQPDSFIVFTAHYDHLGGMGRQAYFPGANDNASGTALLLLLAQYYALHPARYSVAFIAFGAEEAGLVGSEYYVNHPLFPLANIRFLTNLDLMGNGEEGITVVNATVFPAQFERLKQVNEKEHLLTVINSRDKAKNSDHYWFTEKGVPSFFIYTLGKRKAYHDVEDAAATLPLYKVGELKQLLTRFTDGLQAAYY
jgi:aminopeptidase YwaD